MASISIGKFTGFMTSSVPTEPTRTLTTLTAGVGWIARFAGSSFFGAGDVKSVSGRAYVAGVPAVRRVVILTQPPNAQIVYEMTTALPLAQFSFPRLPAGNYVVLDCSLDGSERALVYDWVAPL